jgi:hypothetical protein
LTLDLWSLKVRNKDEPTEPDINGFAKYQAEFGKHLIVERHDDSFIVESYRGKKYVPFDDNISALLGVGHMRFNEGRRKILAKLQ